jgi:hypothetical protein
MSCPTDDLLKHEAFVIVVDLLKIEVHGSATFGKIEDLVCRVNHSTPFRA